jgi:serine/threonine protein kinase
METLEAAARERPPGNGRRRTVAVTSLDAVDGPDMAAPVTSDELVQLLYRSELLEPPRIESLIGTLKQSRRWPGDAKELAQQFVADGVLTFFQAAQLMKGRYRGFMLGKYRVLESIGSGGMANVYLCEHAQLKQRAAVKVVPIERLRHGSFMGRFQREARAVASLQHPNIVRAFDLEADAQYHYLVMEFIDGVNLQRLVKRRGPLTVARGVNYLYQAAQGLQFLFENNIVHRDIKPSNLMLDRRGVIKILDFGLTRLLDDEHDQLTQQFDANRVLGTVDYLAPEQAIRTHDVDIRADIYGLGVVGYFLLTGATPWQVVGHSELSDAEKLLAQQTTQPKPITFHRRDLPPGLVTVIHRMMAKDPSQRPQTPTQVLQALRPWLREIPPPTDEEIPPLSLAAQGSTVTTSHGTSPSSIMPAAGPGRPMPAQRPAPRPAPRPQPLRREPAAPLGFSHPQTHWPPDTPSDASLATRPLADDVMVVAANKTQRTYSLPFVFAVATCTTLALGALIAVIIALLL